VDLIMKNKYIIIYSCIKNKHPDWSHGRIRYCTIWAMRHKRRKVNE
jgi:hypothetical protein